MTKKATSIRLNAGLHQQIKTKAEDTGMSFNGYIEHVLAVSDLDSNSGFTKRDMEVIDKITDLWAEDYCNKKFPAAYTDLVVSLHRAFEEPSRHAFVNATRAAAEMDVLFTIVKRYLNIADVVAERGQFLDKLRRMLPAEKK